MKRIFVATVLAAALCHPFGHARAVTQDAKRKQLDLHHESIRSWAQGQRHLGGGLLLGFAGLSAVGAVVSDNESLTTALWVSTGILGVTGALVLWLPTENERLPEQYQALPTGTSGELDERVARGEFFLRHLRDRAANQRYLGGGISIAAGIAVMALGDGDRAVNRSFDYNLYTGLLLAGTGVVSLLVKTHPEREYEAYQDWLKGGGRAAEYSPYHLVMAPVSDGGGVVGLTYAF